MITFFSFDAPMVANETPNKVWYYIHLFNAAPYKLGQGKLGSMCGKSTSAGCMGSDRDLNPHHYDCKAQTLTTTPSIWLAWRTVTQ